MSDEIFSAVYARPKRRQGITGQTIDAQMRGTICQITELELEELRDELASLRAEAERLRGVLRKRTEEADRADERADKAEAALSDERAHADAMAEALTTAGEALSSVCLGEVGEALQQHRARRQG